MPQEIQALRALVIVMQGRASRMRREGNDLGASAIEWAIISAVVVVLALAVAAIIKNVVSANTAKIQNGVNTP